MDFKIDENLPVQVAQLLTEAGHSVSTVLSEALGGASDEAVLAAARSEGRALITLGAGFTDIRRYAPKESPGIIVLRLRRQDKDHIIEVIQRLAKRLSEESVQERLWIVEEQRVRVRS